MQPTIAITGANGFIGQRLTRHFSDQGWHIKALVRNPNKGQDGELNKLPGVTFAQYDLFNSFDTQLLNNCNAIIHAAYVTHTQHKTANQINQSAAQPSRSTSSGLTWLRPLLIQLPRKVFFFAKIC